MITKTLADVIESARAELSGSYFYDHEMDVEHHFPEKDRRKYRQAYDYCFKAMDTNFNLEEIIRELDLITLQIQHSQDFSLQNQQFPTDFILNFSYKNWIIRINIIAEQVISLVNQIYRLDLPSLNLTNSVFEHKTIRGDHSMYFALLHLVDYLQKKTMIDVNNPAIKKARNEIVHNANFNHNSITQLSMDLFLYRMGASDLNDPEDIYLQEGKQSEKIKKEIIGFTGEFLEKYSLVTGLLANRFSETFNQILKSIG